MTRGDRRVRPVRVLVLATMALLATGVALGQPVAKVRLDPVRMENLEQRRQVTGELRPTQRAHVASEVAGRVVTLSVEVGDEIKVGQEIARLDDRIAGLEVMRREADVKNYEAVVAEREAQLEQAQRDLDIYVGMGSGATTSEVDRARTDVAAATARVSGARAELDIARAELDIAREQQADHVVLAPFAGQVVARSTEVGEWVAIGATVVELLALDEVDAMIDVPQKYISRVSSEGVEVVIRVDALDREFTAPVAAVIATGDRLSRSFPVRVRLQNPDHALRPGMSIIGLVPTGEAAEVLTIHKDALLRRSTGAFVYTVVEGRSSMAPVEVLFSHGERVAITSPALRAGSSVVVEGNEYIFPGQPVRELEGESGASASGAASVEER